MRPVRRMCYERYIKLAHKWKLRDHLERPMKPFDSSNVSSLHQKEYLDGYKATPVEKPPMTEDLSHLNSQHWQKMQAVGKQPKPGNRRKVA